MRCIQMFRGINCEYRIDTALQIPSRRGIRFIHRPRGACQLHHSRRSLVNTMAVQGWVHSEQTQAPQATPATLLRGAARGEPLAWLLQTAARDLVDSAGAVRAGVWLMRGSRTDLNGKFFRGSVPRLEGIILEVGDGFLPERWTDFSPAASEVLALMHISDDELLLRGAESRQLRLGPIAQSPQTLWLPLRNAGKPIGLAMVAWKSESAPLDVSPLRVLADAFALAATMSLELPSNEARHPWQSFPLDDYRARAMEAEALLAGVADSAESGIVLFDPDGNLRLANDRFMQFFGLSRPEVAEVKTSSALASSVTANFREPEKI